MMPNEIVSRERWLQLRAELLVEEKVPCDGCTSWANAFNGTTHLFPRADAHLIAVSRAPYHKLGRAW